MACQDLKTLDDPAVTPPFIGVRDVGLQQYPRLQQPLRRAIFLSRSALQAARSSELNCTTYRFTEISFAGVQVLRGKKTKRRLKTLIFARIASIGSRLVPNTPTSSHIADAPRLVPPHRMANLRKIERQARRLIPLRPLQFARYAPEAHRGNYYAFVEPFGIRRRH
jgi:hypothetical protein